MKYKVSLYKHKLPAVVLAGFPSIDNQTGAYILPTGAGVDWQVTPFRKVLEGIGVDANDVESAGLIDAVFQAFCRRFIGRDIVREIPVIPGSPNIDKHFFSSEFGAIFENEVKGSNVAQHASNEAIRANIYLTVNGVLAKDIVNFFAPIRARHPRLRDEWTEYNSGALVGKAHTTTRNREDTTTGNASTEEGSAEKFNGISPTTERVNSLVENTSESTDSQSHTENESTTTHDVNGIEQKKELAEISSIPSPVAVVMDEIALLFDDNPRTPITSFSGVLEFDTEGAL